MKLNRRAVIACALGVCSLGLATVIAAELLTRNAARGRLFSVASDVQADAVALVLGCAKEVRGRPNLYFERRIKAAIELWEQGTVEGFIVSGDHSRQNYNEPHDMRAALIQGGVPRDRIVCDYAGLRTLDSIVRAKEIFKVEKLVVISQKFHNERAIYIANAHGIEAVGLNAQAVSGRAGSRTNVREYLARTKMLLDIHVLDTQPKYLGAVERLPWDSVSSEL